MHATNVSSDRSDRSERLVGWNRVRALRGKEKNKKSKVFAVDRSIDISHSHPERESLPVPPPPLPIPSNPIRSSPHDTYPSAGESSTYIQFFQCMQVAACIDEIRSETTACAVPSSYTDRQTDRQVCILFTEAVCVCVWLRSSFFSSCA